MRDCKISLKGFYSFLFLYILGVLALIFYLPYTQVEQHLLEGSSLTAVFTQIVFDLSQNYIFLRLVFFFISLVSFYLFAKISKFFLQNEYYYLALFIYLLIPGIFVSFVIPNYAAIPLFLILLFLFSYFYNFFLLEAAALVLLFFTKAPVFIFYFAIALFGYYKKDWRLFSIGAILFIINAIISPYNIGGVPKGYIVELFIGYAIVFTPFYFIATFYALYRLGREKNFSLVWFIASSFAVVSILLSVRQKIDITDFAPFIVIATPLVVLVFKNSVIIRLKRFQKWHLRVCKIVLLFLFIESCLVALSYPIYELSNHQIKIVNSKIYTIKKSLQ